MALILLALGKEFFSLQTSVRCKWRIRCPPLDARGCQCQRADKLCVQVSLNHLRAIGAGRKPRFLQTNTSIFGERWALVLLRRKACRLRYLSCAFKSLLCAAKFVVHQRHLESESGRLGMNAMAASIMGVNWCFLAWMAIPRRSSLISSRRMSAD